MSALVIWRTFARKRTEMFEGHLTKIWGNDALVQRERKCYDERHTAPVVTSAVGSMGMSESIVEPSDDPEAYAAWRAQTRKLVAEFHRQAPVPEEVKQVEAAIIDLVSEYLWLDLGERTAWDLFDAYHWRGTIGASDPSYRSRVRATLVNFYEHLMTAGHVTMPACTRIQDQLAECLADDPSSAARRNSYMRFVVDLDSDDGDVIPFAPRRS
jgi:hypothetical protein